MTRLPVPPASMKLERLERAAGGGELVEYKPERHRLTVAALDYGIDEAKRIKDWVALEQAIDAKIEEQQKFVAWWKATVKDKGGGAPTVPRARDGVLPMRKAEHLTGMANQRVSDLGRYLAKRDDYRLRLLGAEYVAACLEPAGNVRGTTGTGENEWYTPEEYIERARRVLGEIDLDPASTDAAQRTVRAAKYFTKETDGLKQDWHGRVWLNPPYAQPLIAEFIDKLITERVAGHVTAAILLTHNYTSSEWFHQAGAGADAICFTSSRIRFVDAHGELASPTQGQVFFYFGPHVDRFKRVFADIGLLLFPDAIPADLSIPPFLQRDPERAP